MAKYCSKSSFKIFPVCATHHLYVHALRKYLDNVKIIIMRFGYTLFINFIINKQNLNINYLEIPFCSRASAISFAAMNTIVILDTSFT